MVGCDGCSMCCKLIQIDDPLLKKPANKWCEKCSKPGCRIYDTRPQPCRDYACVYLQSQSDPHPLPISFRPDKCKVVIDISKDGIFAIARVEPDFKHVLQSSEIKILFNALSVLHTVVVTTGRHKQIISRTEAGTRALLEMGIDKNATRWTDD